MKRSNPSINLLREQDKDFLSQFFDWAMVGGRFIVIVTESIALMMFLYRFSLDGHLVDLHDDIRKQQGIATNLQSSEQLYRDIQNRLALAKKHLSDAPSTEDILTRIIDTARGRVVFSSFQYDKGSLKLETASPSIKLINSFIAELKKLPQVQAVNVDTVNNKTSTGSVSLTLSVLLKS